VTSFLLAGQSEDEASQPEARRNHSKIAGERNVDQETNKIKRHIDTEREQLVRNLDEIEHRMKSVTDLKAHFAKTPAGFWGAAVARGFLL
jgi:hypothetical protein